MLRNHLFSRVTTTFIHGAPWSYVPLIDAVYTASDSNRAAQSHHLKANAISPRRSYLDRMEILMAGDASVSHISWDGREYFAEVSSCFIVLWQYSFGDQRPTLEEVV